jgi:hypothetical protein
MSKIVTFAKKILKGKNQQLGLAWLYLSMIGLVIIGLIDIGAQSGPKDIKLKPNTKQIRFSNLNENQTREILVTQKYEKTKVNLIEKNAEADSTPTEIFTAPESEVKNGGGIIDIHHDFIWNKNRKEKRKTKQPTLVNNQE